MRGHLGFPVGAAPTVVEFDSVTGGIVLIDRVSATKYRQYVSSGKTLWEAVTNYDNLDLTFISTRGPVYPDRVGGTLYRKYISAGLVLKETVEAAEPEDLLLVSGSELVMTDRSTGTKYREYISSTKELLEVA